MLTTKPSSPTRNPFGPAADKLAVLLALNESSGVLADNLASLYLEDLVADDGNAEEVTITSATGGFAEWMVGKKLVTTASVDWSELGPFTITSFTSTNEIAVSGPVGVDGALTDGIGFVSRCGRTDSAWNYAVSGSGAAWSTDGIYLGTAGYLQGPTNSTGAALKYEFGTIVLTSELLDYTNLATQRFLFSTGDLVTGAASVGQLAVKLNTGNLVVSIGTGAGTSTDVTFTQTWADNDVLTLTYRWFKTAVSVSLAVNGGAPTTQTATGSDYLAINNTKSMKIGASQAGTNAPDCELREFAWLDWRLSDRQRDDVFTDPHIYQRPLVSSAWLTTQAGPMVGCPLEDGTGVTFLFAGAAAITLGTPAEQIRVRYGLSPYLIGSDTTSAHTMAETDQERAIRIDVTSLTAATQYYYHAEWSDDEGTTWYPFAGCRGTFKTMPWENVGCYSDTHHGCVTDPPDGTAMTVIEFGYDLERTTEGVQAHLVARRLWEAAEDMLDAAFAGTVDGWIDGGDSAWNHTGGVTGYALGHAPLWRCGATFTAPGNHEELLGSQQAVSDAEDPATFAQQKLARIHWLKLICNPDGNLYAAGGEDQGEPTEADSDVTAWNPGVDWLPQLSTGAKTYAETYIEEDTGGATWTDKLGANNGPLRNYFAVSMNSDSLAIFLDPFSYELVGDGLHTDTRYRRFGDLGPAQWAWLETTLSAATQGKKFIVMHQLMGGVEGNEVGSAGDLYYGRGSGVTLTATAELRLQSLCRTYNVTAILKGHDHGFALAQNDTVNYVTLGTPSARYRFTATVSDEAGADFPVDYGSPTQQGTDQTGMVISHPQWGWALLHSPASGSATIAYRQTAPDHASQKDMTAWTVATDLIGRYVSEPLTVLHDGGGYYVEVSEAPRCVQVVCEATDGDFMTDGLAAHIWADDPGTAYSGLNTFDSGAQDWATTGMANVLPTQYAQPFQTTRVVVDASHADSTVRVLHCPRTLYTATLANAQNQVDTTVTTSGNIILKSASE